jgi:hypothetical protein
LASIPLPFPAAAETAGMNSLNSNAILLPLSFIFPVPHEKQDTADYLRVSRERLSALFPKAYPLFYGTPPKHLKRLPIIGSS